MLLILRKVRMGIDCCVTGWLNEARASYLSFRASNEKQVGRLYAKKMNWFACLQVNRLSSAAEGEVIGMWCPWALPTSSWRARLVGGIALLSRRDGIEGF